VRGNVRVAHDGAGDELREHGDIGGKVDEITLRLHVAAVDVLANVFYELITTFKASDDRSVLFYWLYAAACVLNIYFDFFSSQTTRILRSHIALLTRLPPSGIYT